MWSCLVWSQCELKWRRIIQYPPAPTQPTDGAYKPACAPNYQPPYPTDQYPPPAPYPAPYLTQLPQLPPYDPGIATACIVCLILEFSYTSFDMVASLQCSSNEL